MKHYHRHQPTEEKTADILMRPTAENLTNNRITQYETRHRNSRSDHRLKSGLRSIVSVTGLDCIHGVRKVAPRCCNLTLRFVFLLLGLERWRVRVAEHKVVSMQESTTGAVSQFLEQEGCECLQSIKLLSFLCGALQRYEEEGAVLNPRLVLCNSIDEFSRALPGGRYVTIGEGAFSAEAGKKILKQCATLATAGWVVFVERSADGANIRFGVLSFLASPTSLELREMVTLGQDQSLGSPPFVTLIEKIDPKTVGITGSRGNTLRIAFSTTRVPEDESGINSFSVSCTAEAKTDGFSSYFQKFLLKALNESHGSILVCRTSEPINLIKGMSDAVMINPPLDLHTAFASYRSISSAESILELQRTEALLIGMLQSDGIVVFSEEGTVVAYRVFYKDISDNGNRTTRKRATKPTEAPVGGARRRAFEGVKALVGTELKAALFRSQDGVTIYQGA